jgi:hypothetical protein
VLQDRADHHTAAILAVEHDMRLKPKATIARHDFVDGRTYAREVREQIEGVLQSRKVEASA